MVRHAEVDRPGNHTFDGIDKPKLLGQDGKEITKIDGSIEAIRGGRAFVTGYGAAGMEARVWDITTGKVTSAVSFGQQVVPTHIAFDGTLCAVIDDKGVLKMCRVKSLG